MKTAISISDALFEAADEEARRLGMSRSQLYSQAVRRFLEENWRRDVTQTLNRIYSDESSHLDSILARMQAVSLEDEGW